MQLVRPRTAAFAAALAALALLAAGCGGSSAPSRAGGVLAAAASEKGAAVKLRTTALGRILVDARGRTLYLFEADQGTKSVCYKSCAGFWPPALVKGRPTAGPGLAHSRLGITTRRDGAHQLTYAGHPLYGFALDNKAGQTKGEGLDDFGGRWYVVGAAGAKIVGAASAQTGTTPTKTTPAYGYGGGY